MPAVRTFSFFAGTAVFINFLLQVCTAITHFCFTPYTSSADNNIYCRA